jgi:hypothetical protein
MTDRRAESRKRPDNETIGSITCHYRAAYAAPLATSNQIQPPIRGPRPVAIDAGAANDERMSGHLELVLPADLFDGRFDSGVLELDHLATRSADEMLVLRVAVVVLVIDLGADIQLAKHPRIHQLGKCPVDRGPAHIQAGIVQVLDQSVGIEMAMPGEDVFDQVLLLAGEPLWVWPAGEVLAELVERGLGDTDSRQGHLGAPRGWFRACGMIKWGVF